MKTIWANIWTILAVILFFAAIWYLDLIIPFLGLYFILDIVTDIRLYHKKENKLQKMEDELIRRQNAIDALNRKIDELLDNKYNNK